MCLGDNFKHSVGEMLRGEKQFILAGCVQGDAEEEAWVVTSNKKEPISTLKSDDEEADMC